MILLLPLVWYMSPDSLISPQNPVPMETTGSRQCGTETERQCLSRSLLCLFVSSSPLFLFSFLTYEEIVERPLTPGKFQPHCNPQV